MNILQKSLRSEANSNTNHSGASKYSKSDRLTGGLHNAGVFKSNYSSLNKYNFFYNDTFLNKKFTPSIYMNEPLTSNYYSNDFTSYSIDNFNHNLIDFQHLQDQIKSQPYLKKGLNDSNRTCHLNQMLIDEQNSLTKRTVYNQAENLINCDYLCNYLDNFSNYGKLIPLACLQNLHQRNHLDEKIIVQNYLSNLNNKSSNDLEEVKQNQVKNQTNLKLNEKFDLKELNSQFNCMKVNNCPLNHIQTKYQSQFQVKVYRISFLETHIYQPQDMPSSPLNMPHQYANSQQFLHNEWVCQNLNLLKVQFKKNHNKILVNVEKKAKYPFIIFGSTESKFNFNVSPIMPTATFSALSPELRITDGLYEICDYLERPGFKIDQKHEFSKNNLKYPLGYIISTYQTFPGEHSEKLEKTWFAWTGGSHLYKCLPMSIGLHRLMFFKRRDLHLLKSNCLKQFVDNEIPIFTYVLLCELFNLRDVHLPTTCAIIDQLRARCCGYTALYFNSI